MIQCKACFKFRHEADENGYCAKCQQSRMGRVTHLTLQPFGASKVIPILSGGIIMERLAWLEKRRRIDAYFSGVSDDEIAEINQKIRQDRKTTKRSATLGEGYIYLLSSSVGYYKIGRALDVEKRLRDHRRDYPIRITPLHIIPVADMIRCETFLLRTFVEKQVQGEWFALDPDDVEWLQSLDTVSLETLALGNER